MGVESPKRRRQKNLWRAKNQAKVTAATRRWRRKNKGAAAAHSKQQREKASGNSGPSKCSRCGSTSNVKAHHPGNNYKSGRTVALCPACHAKTMKH